MDLEKILADHKRWLEGCPDGVKANLSGANLRFANLEGANLREADLREANLTESNLRCADLSYSDLSEAYLEDVNLNSASLFGSRLWGASLINVDLRNADLRNANFTNTEIRKTKIGSVKVNPLTHGFMLACPEEGSFIAYKQASGKIVVLEIPADAKRSSATSLKCRCSKAKVLRIENFDGSPAEENFVASFHDPNFIYKVGEIVQVDDFDENRWEECSNGIHFFLNRDVAVQYLP